METAPPLFSEEIFLGDEKSRDATDIPLSLTYSKIVAESKLLIGEEPSGENVDHSHPLTSSETSRWGEPDLVDQADKKGNIPMTQTNSPALQIALAYYDAWRNRDHGTAMNFVADDVVCDTPFGRLDGAAALHQSETEFAPILTGATLIASFGDDTTALLLYHTHTLPVPSVLSAKYFTVNNGKITSIKGLFDTGVFARAQSESERG